MKTIQFDESSLDPSLSHACDAGWLSPKEIKALKKSGQFDPTIHMADGSIVGARTHDMKVMREQILKHLNQLHPALKAIVAAELKRGNFVNGAGADYPQQGSINVTMSKTFGDQYEKHNGELVTFSVCTDPHYWSADYTVAKDASTTDLLIC